ncbi:MAG: helix-turn-helix transcriptional regulator [Acidobacteriota bacterium]
MRNKIRERGFTQLEVQEALGWGRSYISQLLTKQKSLRIEQVLLILNVIGVEASDFFDELYRFAPSRSGGGHAAGAPGSSQWGELHGQHSTGGRHDGAGLENNFEELQALVRGLVGLLTDKGILDVEELHGTTKPRQGTGNGS